MVDRPRSPRPIDAKRQRAHRNREADGAVRHGPVHQNRLRRDHHGRRRRRCRHVRPRASTSRSTRRPTCSRPRSTPLSQMRARDSRRPIRPGTGRAGPTRPVASWGPPVPWPWRPRRLGLVTQPPTRSFDGTRPPAPRRRRTWSSSAASVRSRSGSPFRRVSDVVYGLLSPQLYALMVHDRGWSPKRYADGPPTPSAERSGVTGWLTPDARRPPPPRRAGRDSRAPRRRATCSEGRGHRRRPGQRPGRRPGPRDPTTRRTPSS